MLRRLVLILTGPSKLPPTGALILGYARIIDGDSIEIAGKELRLHGIDAPEFDQAFWCRGRPYPGGLMAMAALEALTAGVRMHCEVVDHDRHGRPVVKCFSPSGVDVGRRMVASGWAIAYRRHSLDYVEVEAAAKVAGRGLWKGSFQEPEAWRVNAWKRRARAELGV